MAKANSDYIEIYHITGMKNLQKAYKYIMEYCVSNDEGKVSYRSEFSARETAFTEYYIAVYCNVVRHMRLCEYLENICADWN